MKFEDAVLFSWDAEQAIGGTKTREIFSHLQHEVRLDPCFRRPPRNPGVPQLIAVPTILAQRQGGPNMVPSEFRDKQYLFRHPKEERMALYDSLGIAPNHFVIAYMSADAQRVNPLMSYMAATFAVTTRCKPDVIDFMDLVQVVLNSTLEYDPMYETLIRAGLLFITNPTNTYAGWDKASGGIYSLLMKRMNLKRPTVFMDVADGDLLDMMLDKKHPPRKEVKKLLADTTIMKSRLRYWIEGPNTLFLWPEDTVEAVPTEKKSVTETSIKAALSGGDHVGRKTVAI